MPYQSTMDKWESGEAGLNAIPEMMKLAQVMKMRSDVSQSSQNVRDNQRKERTDQIIESTANADRQTLESFKKHLSETEGMSFENAQAAKVQWRKDHPNSYAIEAVRKAGENSEWGANAPTREAIRKGVQTKAVLEEEKDQFNLDNIEEVNMLAREKSLDEAAAASANATFSMERMKEARVKVEQDNTERFMSGVQGLAKKTREGLSAFYQDTKNDPEMEDTRRYLADLAYTAESANSLKDSQSVIRNSHAMIIQKLQLWKTNNQGRDLTPQQEDDKASQSPALASALADYRRDVEIYNGMEESAMDLETKLNGREASTDADGKEIPAVLGLVAELEAAYNDKSPEGRRKVNAITGKMIAISGPISKYVEDNIQIHNKRIADKKQENTSKKDELAIKKLEAGIGSASTRDAYTKARTKILELSRSDKMSYHKEKFVLDKDFIIGIEDDDEDEKMKAIIARANQYDQSMALLGGSETSAPDDNEADPLD